MKCACICKNYSSDNFFVSDSKPKWLDSKLDQLDLKHKLLDSRLNTWSIRVSRIGDQVEYFKVRVTVNLHLTNLEVKFSKVSERKSQEIGHIYIYSVVNIVSSIHHSNSKNTCYQSSHFATRIRKVQTETQSIGIHDVHLLTSQPWAKSASCSA